VTKDFLDRTMKEHSQLINANCGSKINMEFVRVLMCNLIDSTDITMKGNDRVTIGEIGLAALGFLYYLDELVVSGDKGLNDVDSILDRLKGKKE